MGRTLGLVGCLLCATGATGCGGGGGGGADASSIDAMSPGIDANLAPDASPTPYTIGVYDLLGGSSPAYVGYLYGRPIVVGRATTLLGFGVVATAGTAQAKMALYRDDGSAEPGALVAATSAFAVNGAGRIEPAVGQIAQGTSLDPGTYWLMAVYDTTIQIGTDNGGPMAPRAYVAHDFVDPLPDPFPTPPMTESNVDNNYYIMVVDAP